MHTSISRRIVNAKILMTGKKTVSICKIYAMTELDNKTTMFQRTNELI